MVHAMALDEDVGNPVARRRADHDMEARFRYANPWAWGAALLLAACGSTIHPEAPPVRPLPHAGSATGAGRGSATPNEIPARGVLVGEMCPEGAAGRPGVDPLFVRGMEWKDDASDVEEPLIRNTVRQFAVLGEDGRRAGIFTVMGTADVGLGGDVAIGSYAGASTCALPPDVHGRKAADDPACVAATRGCGLAVAGLVRGQDAFGGAGPSGDLDDAPVPLIGTSCIAGDSLIVDIDGDGAAETFSLPGFLDAVRAPAEEVLAVATAAPPCEGSFSHWKARVDAGADPGATPDPKYKVELDVVGIADVDGDGRGEVFVAFRYPDRRTLAIYSATATPARLELVGESLPWQGTPQP